MKATQHLRQYREGRMKTVVIEATFEATYEVEVPDDWEWDGTLDALVELDDLSCATSSLVDYGVRP